MASSLLGNLSGLALERAHALPLFADDARLARKPRCSNTKNFSEIRTAKHALSRAYIQPNSPVAFARLVFDLDWHRAGHKLEGLPIRYLAEARAWENELGLPTPSWVALSRDKNSAHIGYELTTPVARHENARILPQRYLAAVEDAYCEKLQADSGFAGTLCKNPLHEAWTFYRGPAQAYDLHDLAEYVELKAPTFQRYNRIPRGEVGRNVYLFDIVRFWAYEHINENRSLGLEAWQELVTRKAEALNAGGYEQLSSLVNRGLLPFTECKSIAKSVARWTFTNKGHRQPTQSFSQLQSVRGKLGAAASAAAKRAIRCEEILKAIETLRSQGHAPTLGKVSKLAGCSKQALSKHYANLFKSTQN